jgi:hypothetical protein
MRWCWMPRCIHQTFSLESPWIPVMAKGTPLPVRIAAGKPYFRKTLVKTAGAPVPSMERAPGKPTDTGYAGPR